MSYDTECNFFMNASESFWNVCELHTNASESYRNALGSYMDVSKAYWKDMSKRNVTVSFQKCTETMVSAILLLKVAHIQCS